MVEKREPAPGWPILKGEYEVGDVKNCVLVITCGSHLPGKLTLSQTLTSDTCLSLVLRLKGTLPDSRC